MKLKYIYLMVFSSVVLGSANEAQEPDQGQKDASQAATKLHEPVPLDPLVEPIDAQSKLPAVKAIRKQRFNHGSGDYTASSPKAPALSPKAKNETSSPSQPGNT